MVFRGWLKTSFIEYPGKISTVLFTEWCNFRCPFCHNPELVLGEERLPRIEDDEVIDFLHRRIGMIDAVCITGGEPMIHAPALLPFIIKIKNLGFLVKVDTNGSYYQEFRKFFQLGLVDLWGLDYKVPFSRYDLVQGEKWQKECEQVFKEALSVPHQTEIRTTIYPPFHDVEVLQEMAKECSSANLWYWQNFIPNKTLSEKSQTIQPYSSSLLKEWQNLINEQVGKSLVIVR